MGDTCRYVHELAEGIEPREPPPPSGSMPSGELCLFFSKAGWCKFGNLCKHIHAQSDVQPPQTLIVPLQHPRPSAVPSGPPQSSGEVCQFFAKAGWCKFGDACKHQHVSTGGAPLPPELTVRPTSAPQSGEVCQFFAKAGWCKYGDTCKYSHQYEGLGLVPQAVDQAQQLLERAAKLQQAVQASGEACQFFAKAGWCKFGDACKYSHGEADACSQVPPAVISPPFLVGTPLQSGEICQFFAKAGWCKYGDLCKHSHDVQPVAAPPPEPSGEVCQFFAKAGWCKYGDACKHSHAVAPACPPRESSGEICQFFAKAGWCKYGDACKHEHVPLADPPPPMPSGEVCQFFAKAGWCKYGDTCKHSHVATETADLV